MPPARVASGPSTLWPGMQRVTSVDAHPGAWFLPRLCSSGEAFEKAGLEGLS